MYQQEQDELKFKDMKYFHNCYCSVKRESVLLYTISSK